MSNQTTDNNKRIAKNALHLHIRMLFFMVVSLYANLGMMMYRSES